jgi:hypothetical protein
MLILDHRIIIKSQTVAIAFQKYPDSWPCEHERPFVEWLTTQAENVLLEVVNSFAVCDFLEHEGLKLFRVDHQDETHGFSISSLSCRGSFTNKE